jgi:hypothetical protein
VLEEGFVTDLTAATRSPTDPATPGARQDVVAGSAHDVLTDQPAPVACQDVVPGSAHDVLTGRGGDGDA